MPREITLTKGFVTVVDEDDYEKFNLVKWKIHPGRNTNYAARSIRVNGKNSTEKLHRRIMNAKPDEQVDHINGNGLDNRKENLRIVTRSQNSMNKISRARSGFKGVTKQHNRFYCTIGARNNQKYLGSFATAEEAARAYDREAIKLYGEYALLNFKREDYSEE